MLRSNLSSNDASRSSAISTICQTLRVNASFESAIKLNYICVYIYMYIRQSSTYICIYIHTYIYMYIV
jgi:hypothetical protein